MSMTPQAQSWTTDCIICESVGHTTNPHHFLRAADTVDQGGVKVHPSCRRDLDSAMQHWADTDGRFRSGGRGPIGAWYWTSNGHAVPDDISATWAALGYITAEEAAETARVRAEESAAAIAAYRQHRAENGYSAEERHEMRNAFGPDADVVDVLTGQPVQL